jgi:hypothetical protein
LLTLLFKNIGSARRQPTVLCTASTVGPEAGLEPGQALALDILFQVLCRLGVRRVALLLRSVMLQRVKLRRQNS